MDEKKSPFEEIFKREEAKKKEEKREESILEALDKEEKDFFEEPQEADLIPEPEENISKEEKYRRLVNELLEKKFFEEAIEIIEEMKREVA
ncbi:MAG: hypothetical protein ABIN61_06890 [candidate division WOR-3 bacterium]